MSMIRKHYDVVVVGAGPGGMAAAIALAKTRLKVALFDEQPTPGGQIYRGAGATAACASTSLFERTYHSGRKLIENFHQSEVNYFPESYVWYTDGPESIAVQFAGSVYETAAEFLIIATGAQERPVAFKGWQLPGVFGAGAAQILLKTGALVASDRPILYGSGPLLYLLATQTILAGVKPKIILDTGSRIQQRKAMRHLPRALLTPKYLIEGLAFFKKIKTAGVRIVNNVTQIEAVGSDCVASVLFNRGEERTEILSSHIFSHQGVIPETRLAQSLRCKCYWDEGGQCWVPETDNWGESTVEKVFVIGDNAGIVGAKSAPLRGRLTALQVAYTSGLISRSHRDSEAQPIRRALWRDGSIRPLLETLYRVPNSNLIPGEDTMVCRCEAVMARDILKAATEGCVGPNQLKAFTRCGMGACQGRMCGPSAEALLANLHGLTRQEVGSFRARAPIRPISLELLASLSTTDNAQGLS